MSPGIAARGSTTTPAAAGHRGRHQRPVAGHRVRLLRAERVEVGPVHAQLQGRGADEQLLVVGLVGQHERLDLALAQRLHDQGAAR